MLSPPALLRAAIQGERLIMNENSTLNALICRHARNLLLVRIFMKGDHSITSIEIG
ncbi:hypothetical protein D6Y08_005207 [Escherichia coli]|nr:hypothetical protein [Escherichia coli]